MLFSGLRKYAPLARKGLLRSSFRNLRYARIRRTFERVAQRMKKDRWARQQCAYKKEKREKKTPGQTIPSAYLPITLRRRCPWQRRNVWCEWNRIHRQTTSWLLLSSRISVSEWLDYTICDPDCPPFSHSKMPPFTERSFCDTIMSHCMCAGRYGQPRLLPSISLNISFYATFCSLIRHY